jgi:UDP-glucose 4-epimerase
MYLPIMDEDTKLEPKTTYGVSKVAGEGLLKIEAHLGGFDYVIARLFFVYGPNQFASGGYKSVIVKNFERILNGLPAIVVGDGDQILDYVFIEDCVHYLKELMFSSFNGTVNISSGNGVSISRLVEKMIQVAGSGSIVYENRDWTAGTSRVGNRILLQGLFPTYKQTSLTHGLEITFNHLQKILSSK